MTRAEAEAALQGNILAMASILYQILKHYDVDEHMSVAGIEDRVEEAEAILVALGVGTAEEIHNEVRDIEPIERPCPGCGQESTCHCETHPVYTACDDDDCVFVCPECTALGQETAWVDL